MAGYAAPSLRAFLLGNALRDLREKAGLSQAAAVEGTGYKQAWLARVESGKIQVKAALVSVLLSVYGVDHASEEGQLLISMARAPRRVGWWVNHQGTLPPPFLRFVAFESEAEREYSFDSSLVQGLLQTPEYARAVISVGQAANPDVVNNRLTARLTRQELLRSRKPPLVLHALMSQIVLEIQVGGLEVLQEQLAHLIAVADEPNVTIQIVPYSAGEHLGARSGFSLLTFGRGGPVLANIETDAGPLLMETGPDTAHLTNVWADLAARAHPPKESLKMIKERLQ